jgi:hypothetical protein
MQKDEALLFSEIETYVDNFHKQLPLFERPRNVALVHLLRCFEDRERFRTARALFERGPVEFFSELQNTQDSLVWGTRWIWNECSQQEITHLPVDWQVYEEAADLYLHSADYYHLYRCFVLTRAKHFDVSVDEAEKKVKFFFPSDAEMERDAARQLRETTLDATITASAVLSSFLSEWIPLLRELFPLWVEKVDEHSVRYSLPIPFPWVFARWAGLQTRQMRFELPRTWQFGDYNLEQFRSFWKSLLSASIPHVFAHSVGDQAAGTTGLMTGSAVMLLSSDEPEAMCNRFPLPIDVRRSIIRELTYDPPPFASAGYWDPIWQPIFPMRENAFLISPSLILGSSAERNLVTLLNKKPATRELYHRLSLEKETEQLSEIETLFPAHRFLWRRCVQVKRQDGSKLSDADLLVFDRSEVSLMIIQAKWLIRPDYVTEVRSRDEEIENALKTMANVLARVRELGAPWISQVLGEDCHIGPSEIRGLLINRDFLPSGWVIEKEIPAVDAEFLRTFIRCNKFTGLRSLHQAASQLDKVLVSEFPFNKTSEQIRVGEYSFEWPAMEPL